MAATICAVLTAWAGVENAVLVIAALASISQLQNALRKDFFIVFNFYPHQQFAEHHIHRNSLDISHPEGELR